MAGRLIDVGGHKLHIDCTGTGSPTVVLEPGLGEPSTAMAWIARDVAATTRVCVYDRAGRGWSESAGATAGRRRSRNRSAHAAGASRRARPVRARRSLRRRHLRPQLRAPLPRSRSRESCCSTRCTRSSTRRSPSWPAFYEMFRRASAVLPSLSRFGVGRAIVRAGLRRPARSSSRRANARSGQRPATAAASGTSSPRSAPRWPRRDRSPPSATDPSSS